MAEVIEVNDIHELAGYRLPVSVLLDQTPHASFFHTVDWLEAYWKHFGAGQRLRAVVVRAGGQVIGVAPFVVRTRPSRLGPLRVLTHPMDNRGGWYGPLGGAQAATLTMAFRHLQNTPRDWDLIELSCTDHEGADRGRTRRMMRAVGWPAVASKGAATATIDLAASAEHAVESPSSNNPIEFLRHRPAPLRDGDGDPRWELFEACGQIANKTTAVDLAFLRDTHAAAARQGAVDLCLLKQEGQPVAFAYGYHRDGRLHVGWSAVASGDGSKSDLARTLVGQMIEDGRRRGDSLIEFGGESASLADGMATGAAHAWRISHAPAASLRGSVSVLGERLAGRWANRVG